VLQSVLSHALTLGARSAVIEFRYLDPDWRNEHREFYATTFRRYPSVAHRLHFFKDPLNPDFLSPDRPATFKGMKYLGYCVLRPVPAAPVGRTMLKAQSLVPVTCVARDKVNLFGTKLAVEGMPFIAQDGQLARCAQTTTWVTAYYQHLKFGGPRILPGEIAKAASTIVEAGRQLPSPGLTDEQICEASRSIGLPPLVYPLRYLAADQTPPQIICRYLNSGIPVTITTPHHAFVLIGYDVTRDKDGNDVFRFVSQDDEVGPYRIIRDWKLDDNGPWQIAIVPLPPKVYLAGENAEQVGGQKIFTALDRSPTEAAVSLMSRLLEPEEPLTLRSTVVRSNEFKTTMDERDYPPEIAAALQRMQLSRFVWVVELVDRALSEAGEPCVLAEAVIDATDHERDLRVLGWRIPGSVGAWLPDEDRSAVREPLDPSDPTKSIAQPRDLEI
jgi:hypothetical protein